MHTVATNRYNLMGKKDECRFDADGKFDERFDMRKEYYQYVY